MTKRHIFEVDERGLADLMMRKENKDWIVYELWQNAVDTGATEVFFDIRATDRRGYTLIRVTDNDPDGFKDLSHAYTLFAPSIKKRDPTKRGRFNLGEKLVLALCDNASVISTTGSVHFGSEGRWNGMVKRARGTEFTGDVRMNKGERESAINALHNLIVPNGVTLIVNGEPVLVREPIGSIEKVALDTVITNDDGALVRSRRQTTVTLYEPIDGVGWLYEGGIPICEVGDRYDVNVDQKVPLTLERDSVPAKFLRELRAAVLNATSGTLDAQEASSTWVLDAIESPTITTEAVADVHRARFGDKSFIARPGDTEGTQEMLGQGYVQVPAATYSKRAWEAVRESGVVTIAPKSAQSKVRDHMLNGVPNP